MSNDKDITYPVLVQILDGCIFVFLSAYKGTYFNNLSIAIYEVKRIEYRIETFFIIIAFSSDSSELIAYRKNMKVCINRSNISKTTIIVIVSDAVSTTRKDGLHFVKTFFFLFIV